MGRALKYLLQLLAVGAAYFLLARFWVALVAAYPGAAVIWPPAGFALAAVILGGYRMVPAIFVAAYAASAVSLEPDYAIATIAAAPALAAFAGGILVSWWAGGRDVFTAPASIGTYVLIAALVAAIGAGVSTALDLGVGVSTPIQETEWTRLAAIASPRWLSEFAALLLITPVLVLWATDYPRAFDLPAFLETTAIFAAAGAFGALAFGPLAADMRSAAPLAVLAMLPPLWAALRCGPRDTATAALILLCFASWETIFFRGGPLTRGLREGPPMLIVIFLIGIATPSLVLAVDAAYRRRTERALRDTRRDLGQAREQFAQAQKMEAVGQLTGGVAHDFNNLLTVIVGNLNIAQRHLESLSEAPAERLRRVINNAMRGAEKATDITKHLLAFSRKQPLDPKPLHINGLVQGLSDFLRRTLGETITLDIVGANGLWQAEADPVQLESAILNLAVNARDAMQPGGKLAITTANTVLDEKYCQHHEGLVAGEYVRVSVRDTGSGMSPEVLERVFEPFFTTKKAGQGTGLGMSQVYGFVKQSRGHIEIDSRLGRGTIVTMYLPAVRGRTREAPTERPPSRADAAPTILLVEDDHDVRSYIVEILRDLHYRVLEAHDADSALKMIDRNDVLVDLLLTDLVLPGMNGGQLADEVRKRQPRARVLIMTGYSREAVMDQWPVDPSVEMLQKPLTQDLLERKLRVVMG
ncbi:MAG TPA: ATP-binding protein [Xanthobacteraceae bacterium]|nr:ATP-binding protein [Xanthobacteraceae bacterium]